MREIFTSGSVGGLAGQPAWAYPDGKVWLRRNRLPSLIYERRHHKIHWLFNVARFVHGGDGHTTR